MRLGGTIPPRRNALSKKRSPSTIGSQPSAPLQAIESLPSTSPEMASDPSAGRFKTTAPLPEVPPETVSNARNDRIWLAATLRAPLAQPPPRPAPRPVPLSPLQPMNLKFATARTFFSRSLCRLLLALIDLLPVFFLLCPCGLSRRLPPLANALARTRLAVRTTLPPIPRALSRSSTEKKKKTKVPRFPPAQLPSQGTRRQSSLSFSPPSSSKLGVISSGSVVPT